MFPLVSDPRAVRSRGITTRLRRLVLTLVVAVACCALCAHAQGTATPAVHAVRAAEPATLSVWNREILTLRAKIDEVDPSVRVVNAKKRMEELPASALHGDVVVAPGQLNELTGMFLMIDGRMIVGLLPQDVDPESGLTLVQYAEQAAERAREVLRAQVDHRSLSELLRAVALSFAATTAFAAAVWIAVRGRRKVLARLEGRLAQRRFELLGIDVASYYFSLQRGMARLTAFAVVTVAAYVWLTIVFVQFPYTEPWGRQLGQFLRDEVNVLASAALTAVPQFFTVVLILVLARLAARAVGLLRRVRVARAPRRTGAADGDALGAARRDPGRLQRARRADHVAALRRTTRCAGDGAARAMGRVTRRGRECGGDLEAHAALIPTRS